MRHLLPIANEPLVFHVLRRLKEAGISRVAVVLDPREAEETECALARRSEWGIDVTVLSIDSGTRLSGALSAARSFVGGRPFLVAPCDGVSFTPVRDLVAGFSRSGVDVAMALTAAPGGATEPSSGLVEGRIKRLLGRAPAPGARLSGLYLCRPRVLEVAAQAAAEAGAEGVGALGVLERLAARGGRIDAVPLARWWRYTGTVESLLAGNRQMLDLLEPDIGAAAIADSQIDGRVVLDPTARLDSTVVRGPAVIGAGATLSHAYVGPYTSIGDGVDIEAAEVENSVILPGASIRHVGDRLEASVVGRRARVFRDFALPRALRLKVGDDDEVALR
jgi:glucose-1-phosphate thymidylyltransferase